MARSILTAVERIKAEVAHWLTPDSIRQVCQTLGYTWRQRTLEGGKRR